MNSAFRPLAGRRGLIVGVANEHSIAWGCARRAHGLGADLVLSCLNAKAAAVTAPLARQVGAPLLTCDVADADALSRMVGEAAQHLGGLDFVVHSIAWAPHDDLFGRVADSSAEGFAKAMQISCHSFAALARLAEPHMAAGGTLVTMSYLGAEEAVPHYGLMGPVKAALESMVRYLALELGPAGIRVHAVSPGPVPTRAASGLPDFDQLMAQARAQAPLRRLVTLDEIGDCVAFLVGPGATGMTGQTLYVDAGVHAVR
ncbi:enoyl-ACP reductase FabI [Ideonella sp. DXS22W]|uniref:Enoyl-[acyl-carrier-protein] reductase [NADH] n=1 Tax=Pseudaquabacterium inlustre TaxID=2984192 RepID=A0ABU9CEE8_9BURK